MRKLAPSLLSADFSNLRAEIEKMEKAGAQYLHLDIMDGHFVPNITFGAPVVKSIRPCTDMFFDVHLMISEPERYLADFAKAGADLLNVHAEACKDLKGTIQMIQDLGLKAGVTIKPATGLEAIEDVLSDVDMVLVMTVNPGFSGQKLIPEALVKMGRLAELRSERNLNFEIEIDGGVGLNNLKDVLSYGADVIVAGSAVFGAEDSAEAARAFLDCMKES